MEWGLLLGGTTTFIHRIRSQTTLCTCAAENEPVKQSPIHTDSRKWAADRKPEPFPKVPRWAGDTGSEQRWEVEC